DPVLRAVPYHFSVETLGLPSTHLQDGWTPPAKSTPALADVAGRVARLKDESEIQNIQNAYGYYQTRRMWDDVADLFAPDGVMESGADMARGPRAIRAALEAVAPLNLKAGELNDTMQFDTVVTIAPDGRSATARGFQFAAIGKANDWGAWTLATFENAYVKRGGKWMVAHMHLFPRARTDYAQGWARSAIPQALLGKAGRAVPGKQAALQYPNAAFPALSFANPVTGQAPAYPAGMAVLPLTGAAPPADPAAAPAPALPEVERQLAWASAFDGAENVSNAYGYYIDEFLWRPIGDLFSSRGWKELSYVGAYAGNERIYQSLVRRYGGGGRFVPNMQEHQKVMPVVTPSADGRSARIHLYLFPLGTGPQASAAAHNAGHYENQAVIENGLWKIEGMDLDYIWRGGYGKGWVQVDPNGANTNAPPPRLKTEYPPDGELRGPNEPPWPNMEPLALHFRNPVSGREPALLLPEKHY
ncbi:MAG: nuclear transport factor 2 family protein, partial [Sphingomonadales bacterium]|nr:nuclear transport factor 2 family protein [Sphingomonadales bacterium]